MPKDTGIQEEARSGVKTRKELEIMAVRLFPESDIFPIEMILSHRKKWINAIEYLGPNWVGCAR